MIAENRDSGKRVKWMNLTLSAISTNVARSYPPQDVVSAR
jgi:hypothetical protein